MTPKRAFDPAASVVAAAVALAMSGVSVLSFDRPTRADAMVRASAPAAHAPIAAAPPAPVSAPSPAPASAPSPAPASAPSPTPATTQADIAASSDGDGDELLEHWGDPQYWREERVQLAGMGVFLIGAAAVRWKRARRIRRLVHAANA